MLQSQRDAYRLQERLNQISTDEFAELSRKIMWPADVREKYNRRRKRAIWWSMYGNDFLALGVVIVVVGIGLWFFFF